MAKASKNSDLGFKTREVTLTLTPEEAYFLAYVTGHLITGSENSPRIYSDNIYHSLKNIGIYFPEDLNITISNIHISDNTLEDFIRSSIKEDTKE